MTRSLLRPALRPVESIFVPDTQHGRVLVLRDTEGITEGTVSIPPALIPIVARFTGEKTCKQIATEASRDLGFEVDVETVARAADVLEDALFLEGESYQAAREKVVRTFATSTTRPASHAGGAYFSDPLELRGYLDGK